MEMHEQARRRRRDEMESMELSNRQTRDFSGV
jgi:hypothetical protein